METSVGDVDPMTYSNDSDVSTMTSDNVTAVPSNPYDVPPGIIALLAFLYGFISLLAVVGNTLVIVVIIRNRRMHTVTNIFIGNLAFADVVIGVFGIPFQFQAALLQRWVLPRFMCSLAPFVVVVSVNVSIFTLSVIAVDRYIAVLHPFKAGCSKRSAAVIMTVIWAVAVLAGLPSLLSYKVLERDSDVYSKIQCLPEWPDFWDGFPYFYNMLITLMQYFAPLIIISFCYFRIGCHIWGSRTPGNTINTEDVRTRNKRKVVKMMIIVVCLFVLCWLPLQTYNLLSIIQPQVNEYKFINIIWFCCNWLAMSNSCYNPFIYGLLNEKFKREFRILFRLCPGHCLKRAPLEGTDFYSEDGQHTFRRCSLSQQQGRRFQLGREESRRLFGRSTEVLYTTSSTRLNGHVIIRNTNGNSTAL